MVLYHPETHTLERFYSGTIKLPPGLKVPEPPAALDTLWEAARKGINNVKKKKERPSIKLIVDGHTVTPPDGWTTAQKANDAYRILATGRVTHLIIAHQLGDKETGTDILKIVLNGLKSGKFKSPPEFIQIDTHDEQRRAIMQALAGDILAYVQKR